MAIKGVDVSTHNGTVDFSALKKAGIEFVIIRTGFGSDYPDQQDVRFEENISGCEKAGLPYGVYHYSYAKNKAGGINEAKHCLRILGSRKPSYGVWFDMEDNSTTGGDLAGAAEGFCSTIESAGLYAGVYASLNWWRTYLTSPAFSKYDKWVAQYNSTCTYTGSYGIWQFTDALVIGGKNFDGNWAYKDYPSLTEDKPAVDPTETYDGWKEYMEQYIKEISKEPTSSWAENAVLFARKEELMNGDANGQFRPQSNITRQEMAAVLKNFCDKKG